MPGLLSVLEETEGAGQQQHPHENDAPDQHPVQDGRIGDPGRPLHDAVFLGLEGQHQTQKHGGGHVDPQDLHRQDGQSHAREDGGQDDQSLAQVGGKRPGDELGQVVEHPAAFLDRSLDGGEVVVGEDHVGRFFGHLGAGDAHGHSDVRLPQGGSVVDPIARHGHDVAPALQRVHQAQLLLGGDAGEHGGLFGRVDEIGVADGGQLRTVERCHVIHGHQPGWRRFS